MAVLLLGLAGTGWSQPNAARGERLNQAHQASKPAPDEQKQRRAAVRAALEAQRGQKAASTETAPRELRQLSAQERQELRQQLREQRN